MHNRLVAKEHRKKSPENMTRPIPAAPGPASLETGFAEGRSGVSAILALWFWRWRLRRKMERELIRLTPEMLKDLGLTREEARAMAATPFWRGLTTQPAKTPQPSRSITKSNAK